MKGFKNIISLVMPLVLLTARVQSNELPCDSALNIGVIQCHYVNNIEKIKQEILLNKRVDHFLISYGKPSPTAVRAILSPTDEHIMALIQEQHQTIETAWYISQRMAILRQRFPGSEVSGE